MRPARVLLVLLALAGSAAAQAQVLRNSTAPNPPNPWAFQLDPVGGPKIAGTWSPLLDTGALGFTVSPGATWAIGVCLGPASPEIVLPGGTILCSVAAPNPLVVLGPVPAVAGATPVDIPVPGQCPLIGTSLSTQAVLVDPSQGLVWTNAIDIILGAGPAGLYSVAQEPNFLAGRLIEVDQVAGGILSSIDITVPGWTVDTGNGLAENPITGELFAVIQGTPPAPAPSPPAPAATKAKGNAKWSGGSTAAITPAPPPSPRVLVTVCPITGEAQIVGPLSDAISSIAFDANGGLWGATGDGAVTPETLFAINPSDASMVAIVPLGNGDDGEMLGFNPIDGLLYHGSGNFSFTSIPGILETIDLSNPLIPPTVIAADPTYTDGAETNALSAFDPSIGAFWWAAGCCGGASNQLLHLTTGGFATLVGSMGHTSKGLALIE